MRRIYFDLFGVFAIPGEYVRLDIDNRYLIHLSGSTHYKAIPYDNYLIL